MPSPFPGVRPYLELHWHAVHTVLVTDTWRLLNRELPPGLVASAEKRVAIEAGEDGRLVGRMGPDVRVLATEPWATAPTAAVTIDAPFRLEPAAEPVVERYVGVMDESGQLVTVVEFVSPANKRRPGVGRFRRTGAELLASRVHCVEIDLVRRGNWREPMRPDRCPAEAVSAYQAVVRTADEDESSYLFPIHLRDRSPTVPVPLRPGDRPATLPLQAMLSAVYDDGRYGSRLRYDQPLRPPDDAAWAAALLAGRSN